MLKMCSEVEKKCIEIFGDSCCTTRIPYLVSDSISQVELMLSLRFLEWAQQHPEGVVSLPAGGKGFIGNTRRFLEDWNGHTTRKLRETYGLGGKCPDLSQLHLVQMDEFYPISPAQHNSFYCFMQREYIQGMGFSPERALLINSDEIPLYNGLRYKEVFPDLHVDLSLRYRQPSSMQEEIQQQSIFSIDSWCSRYEDRVIGMGGIGFFFSSIGTDGRIAFNVKGSDLHSATRLTETNFATQADAANELGGFEVSSRRLVITVGLNTLTHCPDAVGIVYATGDARADIVKKSLESPMDVMYPASVLQRLPQARFYLSRGAATRLEDSISRYYQADTWTFEKTERAIIGLCKKLNRYASKLTLDDLKTDSRCSKIPNLGLDVVHEVMEDVKRKLARGMEPSADEVIYHTGPHHDDIMLGIMPFVNRQQRNASNEVHFAVMTSGFHSVTNAFLIEALEDTLRFLEGEAIQMVRYPDFFTWGYQFKYDKDVYHYLDNVARKNAHEMRRGFCHRLLRVAVGLWELKNEEETRNKLREQVELLKQCYEGEPNTPDIQKLKGYIREFEEELVWAYMGTPVRNVHHLRLGFYRDSKDFPDMERDVLPVLEQLRSLKPRSMSVAVDPEGMGPDTHYKVFQTIAKALSIWSREEDLSQLKIYGYRNVWSTFHPSEANVYVPVSLNAFAVIEKSFRDSYLTQVKAEFPSPDFNGAFSELAEKIWVNQLKDIQLILGKDFFYENASPLIRSTHGLIFLKQMNVDEFLGLAKEMKQVNS